jgi:hypothetical protein
METESGEVVVGGGKFGKFGNLIRVKKAKELSTGLGN